VDGDRERVPYEADAYLAQLSHYAVASSLAKFRLETVELAGSTGFASQELTSCGLSSLNTRRSCWRPGMSSSVPEPRPLARRVEVTADELRVDLADGRRPAVPLVWFPRLVSATREARTRCELLGDGEGIHWPDADEDLSVAGLLVGAPSAGLRPRAA